MIAIVNSGTQPELRFVAKKLQDSKLSFRYFTSSSVGSDWTQESYRDFLKNTKWKRIFVGRRTIPIRECYIIRDLFLISLCIRLCPKNVRDYLLGIRNRIHLLIVFFRVATRNYSIVIFQDRIPRYWRMIGKRSKFILVLSNATPHYVLAVMNSELNVGKFPVKYFGRSLPHLQELRSFESSCVTAHRIVVPSDFVKSSFQELSEKMDVSKIRVIRLGFDQEIFSQIVLAEPRTDRLIVNQPFQVIFVGQICSRKGVGYLVHAFQQANLPIDSTLTLVGNSINGFADFLIANSTNIRHISFTNQWELNQLYRDMDLFVMPSLIEGFCLSAIEAMGYGIPVLVSPETIDNIQTNQVDGLTATGANVETLRLQLEWAFKNPVKLAQIGVNGALLAKNYTWDLYGEKFKIFLGELAEQEQTGIS